MATSDVILLLMLAAIVLVVLLPVSAYLCVKFGTVAYHVGRQFVSRRFGKGDN